MTRGSRDNSMPPIFRKKSVQSTSRKIVFYDFVTHFGGAQRCTTLLSQRLRKNYDIQVWDAYGCCDRYVADLRKRDIPFKVILPRRHNVVIGGVGRLQRYLRVLCNLPVFAQILLNMFRKMALEKPDLMWTNSTKALPFLFICTAAWKVPIALYAHGWYLREQIPSWQRLMIRHFADAVFAVSLETRRAMNQWGVENGKITVVYNAVDFTSIRESIVSPDCPARRRKTGAFIVLVPGTLIYAKGQYTVLQAARKLKEKNYDFEVWYAGDPGSEDCTGYSAMLRSKADEWQLNSYTRFLGWRDDMPGLMSEADVVVLSSHTEGLPMVVQEALLLRRLVITTPVGGVPDLIENGISGFLVPVDDYETLSEKIEWAIQNPDKAAQIAATGHRRYLRLLDPNRQINLFCHAVEQTIGSRRSQGNKAVEANPNA